jgi:glycosyltransferase involved in cell wall biosynthesis
MVKNIILAVTNDLYTDQRTHRIAQSLCKLRASVTLVGRILPNSPALQARHYKTKRFKLLFSKGFLFYAVYNLRLFFYLIFRKADIIVANDLDTLAACFLAAKIKRKTIVYDSHEYFTEVPELVNRKFVRSIWLMIEKTFLPHVKYSYTVNESIALIYSRKYNISMEAIRNLPMKITPRSNLSKPIYYPGKKIILYQGSLNLGRGLEMAIDAMQYIESAVLVIIGEGDISNKLRQRVSNLNLGEKIKFLGRIAFDQLSSYTACVTLGLTIEENRGLNYFYSLPNKMFDYIQSGIPVVASNFPEISGIINAYNIGCTIDDRNPLHFAGVINNILNDPSGYAIWKSNLIKAASELCWENEEFKLLSIYRRIVPE